MKIRIKNILNFKKPSRIIIFVAVAFIAMLAVGNVVNWVSKPDLIEFEAVYSNVNDKNNNKADASNVMRTFLLENPTKKDNFERLLSVTLYNDGTARLATPPISSYILPKCTYSVADGELLIHALIENEFDEGFFGVKNREAIARFTYTDDETLVFKSATVPLFADQGARYLYAGTPNNISGLRYVAGDKAYQLFE